MCFLIGLTNCQKKSMIRRVGLKVGQNQKCNKVNKPINNNSPVMCLTDSVTLKIIMANTFLEISRSHTMLLVGQL